MTELSGEAVGFLMAASVMAGQCTAPAGTKTVKNNCYQCKHKRSVAGNAHIKCVKPDVDMTGNEHGIRSGWFMYPILFDPTWCTSKCKNFEPSESVSLASKSSNKPG